jgi:hypothetical protein
MRPRVAAALQCSGEGFGLASSTAWRAAWSERPTSSKVCAPRATLGRRLRPAAGLRGQQPALDLLIGAAAKPLDPRGGHGDRWIGRDHVVGKPCHPVLQGRDPPSPEVRLRVVADQVGGLRELPRGGGVVDRRLHVTGVPVPCRRPAVERRDQLRLAAGQLQAQQLREQMVVAVPLAVVVERHQELVDALQLDQQLGRAGGLQYRVAEGTRQALEDRRANHEGLERLGLAGQYLTAEVVDDMAVASLQRGDEGVRVVSTPERQAGQIQPGRPAFGPLPESLHVPRGQVEPHRIVEQGGRLGIGEREVGGADLGQLPAGPPTGQRQRRIDPRRQQQVHRGGQVVDEERHRPVTGGVADQVIVIQHQHQL